MPRGSATSDARGPCLWVAADGAQACELARSVAPSRAASSISAAATQPSMHATLRTPSASPRALIPANPTTPAPRRLLATLQRDQLVHAAHSRTQVAQQADVPWRPRAIFGECSPMLYWNPVLILDLKLSF
eukprot:COSAG02_NODE_1837_length_10712_cov_4.781306_3_plen_131_part_00